ncbi:MAG: division/cell wall cluster transcriptional repressor MraZ [Mycoplasmatales bacterium]|nr:division/cell wall cluster transcriptional repressor MraZ [Mycoplasmatales bacterium]
MFGNFKRSLDNKNRIIIPSKLRNDLGSVLYLTIGPDNILEIRDVKEFDIWKSKLLSTNLLNKNARMFSRMLLGNTHELEIDKQGRISVPEHFLVKTNITKEVTFVGVGNKVELWPTSGFEDFQKQFEDEGSIDDLASKLLKDGIEL